ncbi:MAG TPA: valine--tRNA ligase [Sedimentisphaerales bacterium]|nr:valine--tRNA ligase [Sedimentisphaerales bacterium]
MTKQLSKVYQPKKIEQQINQIWLSGDYFHAYAPPKTGTAGRKPYVIVIPPPNVTAPLHLGHALNNTLQDILIRFRRMQNYNTLWMPGTDHAGIATQTVVEKRLLSEENKSRKHFTREQFVAKVQAWKDQYEAKIIEQLKAMGCSCDWQRTRFTMDDICAKAVRSAFFKLFADGLIYRGKRLVNWDPVTQTVLADDEVEHHPVKGHFWYLRYPLGEPVDIAGNKVDYVTVATTRPETMLGDTAVAMNPADKRAKYLVGKNVRLPIVGRTIPIIADQHVVLPDPESNDEKAKFSTGFLKVTPAHDPDDWEIGLRHDLPVINILAPDGSISNQHGWSDADSPEAQSLLGMDRFEAREAVVEWFRQENLLADVREYAHEVGHSYRSHVPIEPYLSDQWYIAVKKPIEHLRDRFGEDLLEGTDVPVNSLAGLALKPLLDGRLKFIPERYANTYKSWLENLRDWPISRQLWWGHRIPIWYCQKCSQTNSGIEDPASCKKCGCNDLVQDPDVLDTWFSSALWPFSTLGWPDDSPELKEFYPGNVLCTAREIITLWVSRMVMMGQYCAGDIPFSEVFIHAMIQDGEGRKMSKSLGNGIDPLVAINSHGADAMRFTLANMTTETQDIRMPVVQMKLPDGRIENTSPKFDVGRNFCNKLWNASRFVLTNLEGIEPQKFDSKKITLTDRWILSRLAETIAYVTQQLDQFRYSEPLTELYRFFWNDFCDWYLEWAKATLRDNQQKPITQNILAFVLDQTLRLLHPFIPFITEGLFQKLNEIIKVRALNNLVPAEQSSALVTGRWPEKIDFLIDKNAEKHVAVIQDTIRAIRDIKSKYDAPQSKILRAGAKSLQETVDILNQNSDLIEQLAGVKDFESATDTVKPANAAVVIIADGTEIYVHGLIDPAAERLRLEKQKQQTEKAKQAVQTRLSNQDFLAKAKPNVVQQARQKLAELSEQLKTIEKHLEDLNTR